MPRPRHRAEPSRVVAPTPPNRRKWSPRRRRGNRSRRLDVYARCGGEREEAGRGGRSGGGSGRGCELDAPARTAGAASRQVNRPRPRHRAEPSRVVVPAPPNRRKWSPRRHQGNHSRRLDIEAGRPARRRDERRGGRTPRRGIPAGQSALAPPSRRAVACDRLDAAKATIRDGSTSEAERPARRRHAQARGIPAGQSAPAPPSRRPVACGRPDATEPSQMVVSPPPRQPFATARHKRRNPGAATGRPGAASWHDNRPRPRHRAEPSRVVAPTPPNRRKWSPRRHRGNRSRRLDIGGGTVTSR